jgi:Uma2 family endonuclease
VFVPTAAIVVEVLSPGDRTYEKFGFYAGQGVEEIVVADPQQRRIECWRRSGDSYRRAARSVLLGLNAAEVTQAIDWP